MGTDSSKGGHFIEDGTSSAICSTIGPWAFAVFDQLVQHADKNGECFPSQSTIAANLGTSVSTVRRAIADLKGRDADPKKKIDALPAYITVKQCRRGSAVYRIVRGLAKLRSVTGERSKKSRNVTGERSGSVTGERSKRSTHIYKNNTHINQKKVRVSSSSIDEVVAHYQTHHPQSKPGKKERKLIHDRLADGYSVQDLIRAIDGNHVSEFHCGKNDRNQKYHKLTLIMRDSGYVDQFIGHADGNGQADDDDLLLPMTDPKDL